jgi:hypothetical protein
MGKFNVEMFNMETFLVKVESSSETYMNIHPF